MLKQKKTYKYMIPQKKKVGHLLDFESIRLFLFFSPNVLGIKKPTKNLIVNILTFQLRDITLNDIK